MQYCAEGRDQPLLAELLDAAIWLAEQKSLGLETGAVGAVYMSVCEKGRLGDS